VVGERAIFLLVRKGEGKGKGRREEKEKERKRNRNNTTNNRMSKFRKRFRDISITACPIHAPPIVAITSNRVLHRLKLCLVHVAWLHIEDTKDIQNLSWDSINLVEPRVTKVVIVAPSNNGMDAASIYHEK
jgi:hypothetical protein